MDPDDLIELFGRITTKEPEELVDQFSKILRTDHEIARFFLDASSWNVETAVHAYLSSVDTSRGDAGLVLAPRSEPKATLMTDLTPLQTTPVAPSTVLYMNWVFRNDGADAWPRGTRLTHVDGSRMEGTSNIAVDRNVGPGESYGFNQQLLTPNEPGSYYATWRLICDTGYIGDPLWLILTVAAPFGAISTTAPQQQQQQTQRQELEQRQQAWMQQQQQQSWGAAGYADGAGGFLPEGEGDRDESFDVDAEMS